MASDFHRPRSWMDCLSIFAQSRAVAPPGLKLRALMSSGGMPVVSLRWSAACRSAFVMIDLALATVVHYGLRSQRVFT